MVHKPVNFAIDFVIRYVHYYEAPRYTIPANNLPIGALLLKCIYYTYAILWYIEIENDRFVVKNKKMYFSVRVFHLSNKYTIRVQD